MKINIANILKRTYALGPGPRAVIWVQGCPFHCPGCIAPGWQAFSGGTRFTPEEIVAYLVTDETQGLTFSGGEPMLQAEGLAEVAYKALQKKPKLDIICFTGYRYETLLERPPNEVVSRLLSLVDVLIDGSYVSELNDAIGLRGSSNQRVLHLTDRLKEYSLEEGCRQIEMIIEDDILTFVGMPSPEMGSALASFLQGERICR